MNHSQNKFLLQPGPYINFCSLKFQDCILLSSTGHGKGVPLDPLTGDPIEGVTYLSVRRIFSISSVFTLQDCHYVTSLFFRVG